MITDHFHFQVRAIVVSDEALAERRSETVLRCISRLSSSRSNSVTSALMTDEEVFLAQLYRRAQLLNKGFQTAVIQVVRQHEVPDVRSGLERVRRYDSNGSITRVQSDPPSHEVVVSIGFDQAGSLLPSGGAPSGRSPFTRTQSSQSAAGWALAVGDKLEPPTTFRRVSSHDRRQGGSDRPGDPRFERDSSVISDNAVPIECQFEDDVGMVEVHPAPVKR